MEAFAGGIVFTGAINGAVYARQGPSIDTQLTAIYKLAAEDPVSFPVSPGIAPDLAELPGWIGRLPGQCASPTMSKMLLYWMSRVFSG